MSFYLQPPEGLIHFHKLEEYGLRRLHFLLRLVSCRDSSETDDVIQDAQIVDQSDCLINGTSKDLISHYILRLLIGGCQETTSFFLESESAYFRLQLDKMNKEELATFFHYLDKTISRLKVSRQNKSPLSELMYLVQKLKDTTTSWSQLAERMCDDLSSWCVTLPFHMTLSLVSNRLVNLNKGLATVPVRCMKVVLEEQFTSVMTWFIRQAKVARESAILDERMNHLAEVFKRAYRNETTSAATGPKRCCPPLSLPGLIYAEQFFPPCMSKLMEVLRQRHRLKHHDRVQLTLFMKEIGLPLHDALLLWKREYTQPDLVGDHRGWLGSERRYIYNIRHMYGLEGGRINYRAHSCSYIQGRQLSHGDHGGCPFEAYDKAALSSLTESVGLEIEEINLLEKLFELRDSTALCQVYMHLIRIQLTAHMNDQQVTNQLLGIQPVAHHHNMNHFIVGRKDGLHFEKKLNHLWTHNPVILPPLLQTCNKLSSDKNIVPFCNLQSSLLEDETKKHLYKKTRKSCHLEQLKMCIHKIDETSKDSVLSAHCKRCSCSLEEDTTVEKRVRWCTNNRKATLASSRELKWKCELDYKSHLHSSKCSVNLSNVFTSENTISYTFNDASCFETVSHHQQKPQFCLPLVRHSKPSDCFWMHHTCSGCEKKCVDNVL